MVLLSMAICLSEALGHEHPRLAGHLQTQDVSQRIANDSVVLSWDVAPGSVQIEGQNCHI